MRKMAKILSFETIPHLYWKNDKGVKPANGIQPTFCGDLVTSCSNGGTSSARQEHTGQVKSQAVQRLHRVHQRRHG